MAEFLKTATFYIAEKVQNLRLKIMAAKNMADFPKIRHIFYHLRYIRFIVS